MRILGAVIFEVCKRENFKQMSTGNFFKSWRMRIISARIFLMFFLAGKLKKLTRVAARVD